jgi:hypothetical protein
LVAIETLLKYDIILPDLGQDMTVDFQAAALKLLERGWLAIPLGLDRNYYPKRPLIEGWSALPRSRETVESLPWRSAHGLGIVLGPVSKNLAAIDIDDVELSQVILQASLPTRVVRTIRRRCHIYYYEREPSASRRFTITYQGREVTIEFKGRGTQVAAPPTPGYVLVSNVAPAWVTSLDDAWDKLAAQFGLPNGQGQRYPAPWRPTVPIHERNNTAYIEAHMLREAGMPLSLALRYIRIRWEQDYEKGDQDWSEIEATVRSAYRKMRGKGLM